MTRHHLTPAVITDKNGKVTTVHRKQGAASSAAKKIPSPAQEERKRTEALAKRIGEAMSRSHGRQDPYRLKLFTNKLGEHAEAFAEFVESTADEYKQDLERGKSNMSYIAIAVSDVSVSWLKKILSMRDILPDGFNLNEVRFVITKVDEEYKGDKSSAEYHDVMRAHLYAGTVYQRHPHQEGWFDYESHKPLFDLVMRRPEDVEEIMRLHNEYKVPLITDEVIDDYRNHHAALGHGIL